MKLRLLISTLIGLGLLYAQVGNAASTSATTNTTTAPQQTQAAPANSTASTAAPASTSAPTSTAPASASAATAPAASTAPLDQGKVSYSIGVDLGENFKAQGIQVDPAMLQKGLSDALAGGKLMYSKQDMANTLIAFQKQLIAKQQAAFNALSQKNAQEGAAFLAANKTKPGVVTTASGLEYKVLTPGKGASPKDSDVVTVDYSGSFLNGQVFDSSYQRGKPVTFPVSEVIPGWTEALKLMQPGATYEIYVPSNLAYGDRGLGNIIGPKQTLVFKIHLISVKPAATAAAATPANQ